MIRSILRFAPAFIVVALVCASLGLAARRSAAQRELQAAEMNTNRINADLARISELRAMRQTAAEAKRPDQDVIARVNTALAQAGIAPSSLGGLQPELDAALPGGLHRRQSVRISLSQLTMQQLGSFLHHWSIAQPLWVPERIDLVHSREAAEQDAYACTIVLSAVYVSREPDQ